MSVLNFSVRNAKSTYCFTESPIDLSSSLQGFLIDGYPADVQQAGDFESDIGAPSAIIFLEAAPEVLTERLIGRGNFDDNKEREQCWVVSRLIKNIRRLSQKGQKVWQNI